ncbi:MAG: hypothetical protein L6R42_007193 [Xanthoria sp. 1 TBL-2021]|nr:MAG: hypothetical protein L6R42_007193 [Xanthoria sp. 1 TBL-2021]
MHSTPLLTTLLATLALARPNLHHHHNHNALPRNINAGPLVTGTHTPSFPTATAVNGTYTPSSPTGTAAATGHAYPAGTLAARDKLPYEMPTPRMPIPVMTTLRTSRRVEESAYTVITILAAFTATLALARPNFHDGPRHHRAVFLVTGVNGTHTPSSPTVSGGTVASTAAHTYPTGTLDARYVALPPLHFPTPRMPIPTTLLPMTTPRIEVREPQVTTYVFQQYMTDPLTVVVGAETKV